MPFQPAEMTAATLKGFVDRHHRFAKATSADTWPPKRAWSQEAIARVLGFPSFHAAQAALQRPEASVAPEGPEDGQTSRGHYGPVPFEHWDLTPQTVEFAGYDRAKNLRHLTPRAPLTLRLTEAELREHLLLLSGEQERRSLLDGLFQHLWETATPMLWIQGPSALRSHAFTEAFWQFAASTPVGGGLPLALVDSLRQTDLRGKMAVGSPWGSMVKAALRHQRFPEKIHAEWVNRLMEAVMKTSKGSSSERVDDLQACFALHSIREEAKATTPVGLQFRAYLDALAPYARTDNEKEQWTIDAHEGYEGIVHHLLAMLTTPAQLARFTLLRLPDQELEQGPLTSLWDQWAHRHPRGVMIVDGLEPDSDLYPWLLKHLPRLEEQGQRLIVATRSLADLPPEAVTDRLLNRLGHRVVLKGPRSAGADVERLELRSSPDLY